MTAILFLRRTYFESKNKLLVNNLSYDILMQLFISEEDISHFIHFDQWKQLKWGTKKKFPRSIIYDSLDRNLKFNKLRLEKAMKNVKAKSRTRCKIHWSENFFLIMWHSSNYFMKLFFYELLFERKIFA